MATHSKQHEGTQNNAVIRKGYFRGTNKTAEKDEIHSGGRQIQCTVREDTSSGRKCDVTFLLFLRKYAKSGKNNREKLVPNAKSSLPVSRRNIREL